MKKLLKNSLLISAGVALLSLASACSSTPKGDDDDTGGTGGSSASGGTGGTSTSTGDYTLIIDSSGWMDIANEGNNVGVQGSWYPYGDQYGDGPGDAKCIKVGMHAPTECAIIEEPAPPPAMGFPNTNGMMHTKGTVEPILTCPQGLTTSGCPDKDFSNMWGAGIGFDFNADKGEDGGAKHVWDPDMYGVVGVAFTIDQLPLGVDLRVEFPMQLNATECGNDVPPLPDGCTTDSHSAGAPYWGSQSNGDGKYGKALITPGAENKIYFDDTGTSTGIESPQKTKYLYDRHRMLGMQFHVVAGSAAPYEFTISNVRLLRSRE